MRSEKWRIGAYTGKGNRNGNGERKKKKKKERLKTLDTIQGETGQGLPENALIRAFPQKGERRDKEK